MLLSTILTINVVSSASKNYDDRSQLKELRCPNRLKIFPAFSRRLKDARIKAGLSQKRLGIEAGIDEFVASTRINRYEKGVHQADEATAILLAHVLGVPLAYFYAEDDSLAEMILGFCQLNRADRNEVLDLVQKKLSPE